MNKRLIFSRPIEIDRDARLFIENVNKYNGVLTDDLLASMLSTLFREVNERDVRKIAERLNKRKYIGYTDTTKYHKYKTSHKNATWHKVVKDTDRMKKEVDTRFWDMIATAETYKIYLEDSGLSQSPQNTLQLSMVNQLLGSVESEAE